MISSLNLIQDNKVVNSDLMAIHSPFIFLVDAIYTGEVLFIYCKIYNESDQLLNTFKCIPYKDITATQRRFMFVANSILQGEMEGFEDFAQSVGSFVPVPDITKKFKLVFSDPDDVADDLEVEIMACHGVKQFGSSPNMSEIYTNESETVTGVKGHPVYVYFYNDNASNVISLSDIYTATLIVSDSSGFVNESAVTINGETKETDTGGEVSFQLENGTWNYTIKKYGYATYNGSIVINNGNITVNVTLTELTLKTITFTLDKLGFDGVRSVVIYWNGEIVANGLTTYLGNTVDLDVYVTETYTVFGEANFCSGKADYSEENELTALDTVFNIVPYEDLPQLEFTFNVASGGVDVEDAEITSNGVSPILCYSAAILTNASGIAIVDFFFPIVGTPPIGGSWSIMNYHVTKVGYSTVTGTGEVVLSDYNPVSGKYEVTINITLIPE